MPAAKAALRGGLRLSAFPSFRVYLDIRWTSVTHKDNRHP